MFGSETLEVAIGLAVLFSFLSLFTSSLRETIEARAKERSQLLHDALSELISSKGCDGTASLQEFYESITISPLFGGAYDGARRNLPQIPSPHTVRLDTSSSAPAAAPLAAGAPPPPETQKEH